MKNDGGTRRRMALAAALVSAALGTACEVTNPGPVSDDALTLPAAQIGFVNGAKERLTEGLGFQVYSTALVAREIFPGGTVGSYGHSIANQAGHHEWNSSGPNNIYPNLQQARWIAEEALRRFNALDGVQPATVYEAYVTAGFANRILGENWCEAVFDGGSLQPHLEYFKRAEKHFGDALALVARLPATAQSAGRQKASGGRAQVRVGLKDWTGAAADAGQVTTGFVFKQEMDFTGGNVNQRNHLAWAVASKPYRSYTVRFTFQDGYFTTTGDPRAFWLRYAANTDTLCGSSLQGYGRVPCTQQGKYLTENDDINLVSGREMRLIEAEAFLTAGNVAGAIAKINEVRTTVVSTTTRLPLPAYAVPATAAEAWTLLKRERLIELWLEGRRMGDQRRWAESRTPGSDDLPNFEARSSVFTQYPRGREVTEGVPSPTVLCYNISDAERNTNPNIPDHS